MKNCPHKDRLELNLVFVEKETTSFHFRLVRCKTYKCVFCSVTQNRQFHELLPTQLVGDTLYEWEFDGIRYQMSTQEPLRQNDLYAETLLQQILRFRMWYYQMRLARMFSFLKKKIKEVVRWKFS
jgi:hypothetical protein